MSSLPGWQRWVPGVGTLTAAFTTMCCLGVTAALSLATAVGATFMTTDKFLQPLLVVTLLLTAAGSTLTMRGHRNPLPLILTVGSGIWVFMAIFGSSLFGHAEEGHGGHSGPNPLAWTGLGVLVATQIWDLWLARRRRRG